MQGRYTSWSKSMLSFPFLFQWPYFPPSRVFNENTRYINPLSGKHLLGQGCRPQFHPLEDKGVAPPGLFPCSSGRTVPHAPDGILLFPKTGRESVQTSISQDQHYASRITRFIHLFGLSSRLVVPLYKQHQHSSLAQGRRSVSLGNRRLGKYRVNHTSKLPAKLQHVRHDLLTQLSHTKSQRMSRPTWQRFSLHLWLYELTLLPRGSCRFSSPFPARPLSPLQRRWPNTVVNFSLHPRTLNIHHPSLLFAPRLAPSPPGTSPGASSGVPTCPNVLVAVQAGYSPLRHTPCA